MDSATARHRLGAFECLVIKDGTAGSPGLGELMKPVPPKLADYALYMEGGLMLVDTPDRRILIDVGNGPTRGPRTHAAEAAFEAEGIAPESIDTILLTHGDPDHIMGLLTADGDLVYPNASLAMHRDLWEAWHAPPSAGLYFEGQAAFVRRLVEILADRLDDCGELFDDEREVVPGIRAIPALGHRTGHSAYLIESNGERLLHVGDAAVDPVYLEYPGVENYRHDTDRERACSARRMLVERAIAEDAFVVGSHFQLPGIGRLTRIAADRYAWAPIPDEST